MIEKFSPQTIKRLKNYVYVYSDPDTGEYFYVGRGKGNRAFDHLKEVAKNPKTKKIKELRKRGKDPKIEILAYGLTEQIAKNVEGAVIEVLEIDNLTNRVRNHEAGEFGKLGVDEIESKYGSKVLKRSDITDNVIVFRLTDTYYENMSAIELYDATRQFWNVVLDSVEDLEYALAVHDNVVLEVYKIEKWYPAFTTLTTRPGCELLQPDKNPTQYEFIGRVAEDKIRNKYLGKSTKGLFKPGNQRGFNYIRGKNR